MSDWSTTGCSSVVSQMIQATKPTAAMQASITIKGEENQSASLPVSSMIWSEPTQNTNNNKPTRSMGSLRVGGARAGGGRRRGGAAGGPGGAGGGGGRRRG